MRRRLPVALKYKLVKGYFRTMRRRVWLLTPERESPKLWYSCHSSVTRLSNLRYNSNRRMFAETGNHSRRGYLGPGGGQ